jgi:hypothetical protein
MVLLGESPQRGEAGSVDHGAGDELFDELLGGCTAREARHLADRDRLRGSGVRQEGGGVDVASQLPQAHQRSSELVTAWGIRGDLPVELPEECVDLVEGRRVGRRTGRRDRTVSHAQHLVQRAFGVLDGLDHVPDAFDRQGPHLSERPYESEPTNVLLGVLGPVGGLGLACGQQPFPQVVLDRGDGHA